MFMKKGIIFFIFLVLLITGCTSPAQQPAEQTPSEPGTQEVTQQETSSAPEPAKESALPATVELPPLPEKIMTEDNLKIAYTYRKAEGKKAVLLLHMFGGSKADWNDLVPVLNKNGYTTLAIDLRGHGESDGRSGSMDPQELTKMMLDVKAAKKLLEDQQYTDITLLGASVGANNALLQGTQDPTIKKLILLSPSNNQMGSVKTTDMVNNYKGQLYILTGSGDAKSYKGSEEIIQAYLGQKEIVVYETSAHGTELLTAAYGITDTILAYLKK